MKMATAKQLEKARKKIKKLNRIKPDKIISIQMRRGDLDILGDSIENSQNFKPRNITDFVKKIKVITTALPELKKTHWTVSFVNEPKKGTKMAVAIIPINSSDSDEDMRLFVSIKTVPFKGKVLISFELSIDTSFNGHDWEILEHTQFQIIIDKTDETELLNKIDELAFKNRNNVMTNLLKADKDFDLMLLEDDDDNNDDDRNDNNDDDDEDDDCPMDGSGKGGRVMRRNRQSILRNILEGL